MSQSFASMRRIISACSSFTFADGSRITDHPLGCTSQMPRGTVHHAVNLHSCQPERSIYSALTYGIALVLDILVYAAAGHKSLLRTLPGSQRKRPCEASRGTPGPGQHCVSERRVLSGGDPSARRSCCATDSVGVRERSVPRLEEGVVQDIFIVRE